MKNFLRQLSLSIAVLTACCSFLQAQSLVKIPYFVIVSPAAISEIYPVEEGAFTTPADWGKDLSNDILIAPLKMYTGPDSLLCDSLSTVDFSGKIAVIGRGVCEFGLKAYIAQQKGALAVIIMNHNLTNGGIAVGMGAGALGSQVTIPVINLSYNEGLPVLTALNAGEEVTVSMGVAPAGFTLLEGNIKIDVNNNCIADPAEAAVPSLRIGIQSANGTVNVRNTDSTGHYKIYVNPANAPFQLTSITANQGWIGCPGSVTIPNNTPDTIETNLTIKSAFDCVQLETEITAPFLRRCFQNYFTVEVCNKGTVTATGAYVDVALPAEFGLPLDATIPFTTLNPGNYRFELGDLEPFACASVQFNSVLSCDSTVIGQTLCYSAHAYPDTSCVQPSAAWTGASVTLDGACQGNTVEFVLSNQGAAGMNEASEYIVIQDDVMYMTVPFQLNAGESQTISLPADGSTWRVEARQVPNHPLVGNPSEAVEGCTTNGAFSTGFLMMFPIDDEGLAIDEECQEIIGSFDPNDKQGFPLGFTAARLIRPEVEIDYLIRFQNTGTDTAFTVVVRDTLTAALNAMSIRSIVCSHPYLMEIKNDSILIFRFNNILLVDSFTNEAGSNGYLSFKIAQKANNPFGTIIENRAGIYFDFNPPVMTNTTHHEVGEVLTVVPVKDIPGQTPPLVYPNPVRANTMLQFNGIQFTNATYRFIDLQGKTEQSGFVSNNRVAVSGIPGGMHILQIVTAQGEQYTVKVLVE